MRNSLPLLRYVWLLCLLTACAGLSDKKQGLKETDFYSSKLFREVQLARIFPDSKTFVDCTPKTNLEHVLQEYEEEQSRAGFSLENFVKEHFELPDTPSTGFSADTSRSMEAHIKALWPVLTREPDVYNPRSSLLPLPHAYIVPGGRFREIYYWDSYFTLEGLMVSGQEAMALNMVRNFAFLIDSIGFIPNGNRAYYLGRSQPPFFALMLDRVARDKRELLEEFLPQLQKEYDFWMEGADALLPGEAHRRLVRLPDGSLLNRYWDDVARPRPESFREDYELAHADPDADTARMYRHLRAGAESGWDFCSRWLADQQNLSSIHTTDIVPVDLNSLLYYMEMKLAEAYDWSGDIEQAQNYLDRAETRKQAIQKYLWDEQAGFFVDYDWKAKKPTGVFSLAGAYPLFLQLADKAEGRRAAARLASDFLKPGGFVSTLKNTGEQWDAPNGWAPLQWITINGLFYYDHADAAFEGAERWLQRNRAVYKATGKMMEKYNVMDTTLLAGGGEYPLQDGFGWTNGVALALQHILEKKEALEMKE